MPFDTKETWEDDLQFKEMSCYVNGQALEGTGNSGYNIIGVGGRLKDRECDMNEQNVLVYLQNLDDGNEIKLNITPEAALRFADLLHDWAYEAENSNFDVNVKMERLRKSYYTQEAKEARKQAAKSA